MKNEKKSNKVQFSLSGILNNPVSKRSLEGFIEEIVISKTKMKQEKEALRDIVNEAKDSLGIPPKILNGLVAERMNPGSIEERQNDLEEICGFAEGLGIKDTE